MTSHMPQGHCCASAILPRLGYAWFRNHILSLVGHADAHKSCFGKRKVVPRDFRSGNGWSHY